jgi:hypothetical protein
VSTHFATYEEPTIRAFFPIQKRDRYIQLLGKSNRRPDGLKVLHHEIIFDPKWSTRIESTSGVAELLKARGAGPRAYLMGTSQDQSIQPLEDAVARVERESGILVCTPGRLAYYCAPGGKRRLILERGTSPQKARRFHFFRYIVSFTPGFCSPHAGQVVVHFSNHALSGDLTLPPGRDLSPQHSQLSYHSNSSYRIPARPRTECSF